MIRKRDRENGEKLRERSIEREREIGRKRERFT